jgi:hypothetical protein
LYFCGYFGVFFPLALTKNGLKKRQWCVWGSWKGLKWSGFKGVFDREFLGFFLWINFGVIDSRLCDLIFLFFCGLISGLLIPDFVT